MFIFDWIKNKILLWQESHKRGFIKQVYRELYDVFLLLTWCKINSEDRYLQET